MRKKMAEILSEHGYVPHAKPRAQDAGTDGVSATYAAFIGSDAPFETPSATSALAADGTAPTIGAGKMKQQQDLVTAASAAFREAAQGDAAAARTAPPGEATLVPVVPQHGSDDASVPEPKVAVVSEAQGKILGMQG